MLRVLTNAGTKGVKIQNMAVRVLRYKTWQ